MSIILTPKASPSNLKLLPYFALTTGIIALSMTAMFVRWADAPATITGFYRLLISSTLLIPIFLWRNSKINRVTRKNLIFPILGGLFTALDLAFWNTAVFFTTASNATLLGNTAPIWVALVTIFIFRHKLPKGFWIGLILALGGAALVLGNDFIIHPRLGTGDLLALAAGFFYGGYLIFTQRGRESLDPISYITIMVISASFFSLIINLVLGYPFSGYSRQTWITFLSLALVSQILGYMAVSYALGHLPASVVAPTMIGQPILTTILAIPFLGEIPKTLQLAGGLVTLAGIYIVHNSYNKSIVEKLE